MDKNKEKVKDRIGNVTGLPTLPNVVGKIIEITGDPKSAAKELVEVIKIDQSLTARVLKIVNSPYYGFHQKISTLDRGVTILGYNNLRSLAISASVFEIFPKNGENGIFDLNGFWEHSIGCGIITRMIKGMLRIRPGDLDAAFTAGLLHDIGKVILDKYANEEFKKVIQTAREKDILIADAEREIFRFDHTDVGGWLAGEWGFPKDLVDGISYHHNPENRGIIPACIHFADIICRQKKIGSGGGYRIPQMDPNALEDLNLIREDIIELQDEVDQVMKKGQVFFNFLN